MLYAAASWLALAGGLAAPGLAEDAPGSSAQGTDAASDATGSATPGLQEIIVTASRRATNLQKESRDIAVVSSDQLVRQGITDPVAIQKLTPGLTIAQNGSQLQVSVRGVGDRTISSETDPAVSLNVDGIFYPRSYEAAGFFFDLDRIEVLKGPQGTLYGRNASAGALNLIVAKPKFETSGFVDGELGNYAKKRVTAALNTSWNQTIAVRLSGQWIDRDGYLSDGFNDDKEKAVRLQVLIAPTTDTSLLLSTAYSHRGGLGQAAVLSRGDYSKGAIAADTYPASTGLHAGVAAPALASDPWTGPTDPATLAYYSVNDPGSAYTGARDGRVAFSRVDVYTLSANFEHKFDWGTLTLLPSFVGAKLNEINLAGGAVGTQENSRSNQFAMEGRLSSPEDARIKWVVGGFAALEDMNDYRQSDIPIGGPDPALAWLTLDSVVNIPKLDDRTWAVFGETNASITDRLRLILGARYTWEHKETSGYVGGVVPPSEWPLKMTDADYPREDPNAFPPVDGQLTDHAFNYRAGVEYDIAPQNMVYATVSTGFKAGGFIAYKAGQNTYKPERLQSFEVGSKNRFFDNRLQLNVEGFYWRYKNKQETFIATFPAPYGPILDTANAGRATLYGADASAVLQITPNDVLSIDGEYLHSKYDKFVYTVIASADPSINCQQTPGDAGFLTTDCSGYPLIRAPKWSGHISFDHTQPLGDNLGRLILQAQMRFSSGYWFANNFTRLVRQDAYQTYDASLTWEAPDKRVSVTAFIDNISNHPVYIGGASTASYTDASVAVIGAPRTFGARARFKF